MSDTPYDTLTILLVDDLRDNLRLLETILVHDLPHVCYVALTDAREALAWLQQDQADLIIADVRLTGLRMQHHAISTLL